MFRVIAVIKYLLCYHFNFDDKYVSTDMYRALLLTVMLEDTAEYSLDRSPALGRIRLRLYDFYAQLID
jgi:hypothetical protein